jgi:hypothetical protein
MWHGGWGRWRAAAAQTMWRLSQRRCGRNGQNETRSDRCALQMPRHDQNSAQCFD